MWNRVDQRINSALNRIRQAFRGVLNRVNSAAEVQTIQGRGVAGEKLQDAELFQHYGFTSHPLKGTMAVVLPLNGKTSHGIVIATEHARYRLKSLKPGEVAIYTDEGSYIILRRGRIIEVNCDEYIVNARNKYQVNTTDYNVTASAQAKFDTPLLHGTKEISDGKSTMNKMRDIHNGHDHKHGDPAGITEPPGQKM